LPNLRGCGISEHVVWDLVQQELEEGNRGAPLVVLCDFLTHDQGRGLMRRLRCLPQAPTIIAVVQNDHWLNSANLVYCQAQSMFSSFAAANPGGLAQMVKNTVARFEHLDVLINNASSFFPTEVGEVTLADWDDLVGTNLKAPLFLAQAAAPHLKKRQGSIINISSVGGQVGLKRQVPYTASKGAVKMLTKGMAIDWGPLGINVNGIGPGYFKTELNQKLVDDPTFSAWLVGRTPSRRWGELQDLGGAAVFLASPASRFVNGHILYVDGGVTATL
jgi:gluconate 5-dehydrogenase